MASMAGTISSARRISDVATLRPSLRAATWTSPTSRTESGLSTLAMAARVRSVGTTSRRSSRRLGALSVDCDDRPVTLPLGRARFSTSPSPTGSPADANTIGMTDVACLAARTDGVPCVTITSTLSRTSSVAISASRSFCPSAQRYSIRTVRPSIQPSSRSRFTKADVHWLQLEDVPVPKNPIIGIARCCARAENGHVTAALPRKLMKARRCMSAPKFRRPHTSCQNDRLKPSSQALPQSLRRRFRAAIVPQPSRAGAARSAFPTPAGIVRCPVPYCWLTLTGVTPGWRFPAIVLF